MITLKDMSTTNYIKKGLHYKSKRGYDTMGVDILLKYNIKDYSQLYFHVHSNNPEFQHKELLNELKKALTTLEKMQQNNQQALLYSFPNYEQSPFDPHHLNQTDKLVTCDLLPLFSPLYSYHPTSIALSNYNIAQAKELLKHIDSSGKNSFISCTAKFGEKKAQMIARAINFYEEQILRVASTLDQNHLPNNLFSINLNPKKAIIEQEYESIVLALMTTTQFIWGSISEKGQKQLLNSIRAKTQQDNLIRTNLTKIIANYTTLEELQNPNQRTRALSRFITK